MAAHGLFAGCCGTRFTRVFEKIYTRVTLKHPRTMACKLHRLPLNTLTVQGFAFSDELPLVQKLQYAPMIIAVFFFELLFTLQAKRVDSVPLDLQSKGIEVGVYNPVSSFGSQTLILDNFGLQIQSDR